MSFEETMAALNRYMVATDALAAIGAQLSLSLSGDAGDPKVVAAVGDVVRAAGLPDIGDLTPQQRGMALGLVKLYVREAEVFLADPATIAGWGYTDPVVLEGWGRGSSMIPQLIARALPDLGPVRSVLDVGVGVGWLAVTAAGLWPDATIVGLDIWEPSLERARANIEGAGLADRITVRNQDANDLDDRDTYDLAWVPTFFLNEVELPVIVERVVTATKPGGTVVVGRFSTPPDPLARTTSALRTVRSGGAVLSAERSCDLLTAGGCKDARQLDRTWPAPVELVVGTKPGM